MPKPANTGDPARRATLVAAGECISPTHDPDKAQRGDTGTHAPRPVPATVQGTFDPNGTTRSGPTIGTPYCDACAATLAARGMFAANQATTTALDHARKRLGV